MIYATATATYNGKKTFTVGNIVLSSDAAERGRWEQGFFDVSSKVRKQVASDSQGVLLFELRLTSADSSSRLRRGRSLPSEEVVAMLELQFRNRPRRGGVFA
jgi:hypothetical protein